MHSITWELIEKLYKNLYKLTDIVKIISLLEVILHNIFTLSCIYGIQNIEQGFSSSSSTYECLV